MSRLTYSPQASMCTHCRHFLRDCEFLKFEEMLVIGKLKGSNILVVKCSEFKRKPDEQFEQA